MSDFKLTAQPRTEFGKGAARRIRRGHQIPAVVYGHGSQPLHITLPGHETMLALKLPNALLDITVEGADAEQRQLLALAKDVQRDPVRRVIEHVDLVIVRRGEKVHVDIPVHVVGETAGDTVVTVEHQTLTVEAEATNLPELVEVSVDGVEAGTRILAGDVLLPEGSTLVTDPEVLVVNVTAQVSAEAAEAELAEAEAAAGIEHEVAETEQEQPAEGSAQPEA